MRNIVYIILIGGMLFSSCGDFLKEYSKELTYAQSCEDLDEVLIGNGYMMSSSSNSSFSSSSVQSGQYYCPWLHVMDDDITEFASGGYSTTSGGNSATFLRPFYGWQDVPFQDLKGNSYDDPNWKKLYEHIGYLNVIIAQAKEFGHDPEALRNRVTGEAEFLRGAYYFLLVNMYAKPYVKATAKTDPGVPLNLTEQIEDIYFSRASVEDVYAEIVKDLQNAAKHLSGVVQPSFYRVNETAARVLLSRVYLYMGEWELALQESSKAIELGCPLMDLNKFEAEEIKVTTGSTKQRDQYFYSESSPEILFTQGTNHMQNFMYDGSKVARYRVSDELMALYSQYAGEGTNDLRSFAYFLTSAKDGNYYFARKNSVLVQDIVAFDSYIIRTAEAYLNKAEAEAMLGQDAFSTLKVLLEHRFEGGRFPVSLEGLTGKELVGFIRDERRRELCFECQRWFDLRRYAVCEKYAETKEIVHPIMEPADANDVTGISGGDYVLKSYGEDAAWVLPIPDYEITYNKGNMVANEKREHRTLR